MKKYVAYRKYRFDHAKFDDYDHFNEEEFNIILKEKLPHLLNSLIQKQFLHQINHLKMDYYYNEQSIF